MDPNQAVVLCVDDDAATLALLQGALEALKGAVNNDELAFAGLFSSVEAQTAVLAMAGNQADNLTSKTAEMYEATEAANAAFAKQTDTLAYDIQMIKNLGANFLTQLGTNILPYVRELAEAALPVVTEALEKIGDYMTGTIIPAAQTAAEWVVENKDVLLALAAGIGTAVAAYKAYKKHGEGKLPRWAVGDLKEKLINH